MANTLTTLIPKLLATTVIHLRDTWVMPSIVNTDFDAMGAEKGDTIDVDIPQQSTTVDVVPGVTPTGDNVAEDSTTVKVSIPLNKWKMSKPFQLSDKDWMEVDAREMFIPRKAQEAIHAIVDQVNTDLLAEYTAVYGLVGTAGTTPFVFTATPSNPHDDTRAAVDARKLLTTQKCPKRDRRMVLDLEAGANALGLRAFQAAEQFGNADPKREGEIGRAFGFDWYEERNIPTHTSGTHSGTVTVNGAAIVGATSIGIATAAGADFGSTIGDIVTFAGDSQQYVLTTTVADIGASATTTVVISPPLKVALSGGEAVSKVASHVVSLAFHRDAFALVNRPLIDANGFGLDENGFGVVAATDPESGISMRLERKREHKRVVLEYDILYGVKCVRPELAVRIAG